ncbi:MAG: hypothetical protein II913_00970 [Elusimicrobiaceae bacterium]|nr:hypothetical protein [Elusimicrobiaceae bacterium]
MRIVAILCLLLPVTSFSQNLYQIVKTNRKGVRVHRTITVHPIHVRVAERLLSKRTLFRQPKINTNVNRVIITAEIRQPIVHPTKLTGGYNYLRTVNKKFRDSTPQWRGVTDSGLYNGVHHIVTQTVIDAIAKEVDIKDTKEMKANAPAVYSALHGNARYSDLFHDHAALLETYHQKGVWGIVTDFYKKLNEKNKEFGLPLYEQEVIDQTLLEAELWAKHWGIRWK